MDKQAFIEWAKKLQSTYHSSSAVHQQLGSIDLVALVGPTGVGKTTIIEQLGLPYVQSDVSRAPRDGEKNNHEYHFRDDYFGMLSDIKEGNYAQF